MVISVTTGKKGNIKSRWLKQSNWDYLQCKEAVVLFSFTTDVYVFMPPLASILF